MTAAVACCGGRCAVSWPGASVYLVPRDDGTVVVGATVEERGFDTTVTAGAVYELLRDAHRVVPGVTELELVEARAGLRPGSPDNAPIVGARRSTVSSSPPGTIETASCSPLSPPTRWPPWPPAGNHRPRWRRSPRRAFAREAVTPS